MLLVFKRITAFMIDWCLLLVYMVGLFFIVSPLVKPLFSMSPFIAELAGFYLLTLNPDNTLTGL